MPRPAKAIETQVRHNSKNEIAIRKNCESALRGDKDKILPPDYLSKSQKKIFAYIVDELKASNILGNLDIFVLSTCSIAIDRLQFIEKTINEDPVRLTDKSLLNAKDKYSKDLYKCMIELSLSPQSRAKLSNINLTAQQDSVNPLIQAIKGGLND